MQAIIDTLAVLKGVRQVGVYKNGVVINSNFTADFQQAMMNSSKIVAQVFLALEAVEKTHNEIFIGINSGYLAGFRLSGGYVVLLLADKKINFPMISMGIKSVSEMLKQRLEEEQEFKRQSQLVSRPAETKAVDPTNDELTPFINQYAYLLTAFLGPAARIVVDDAVEQWKRTYVQSPHNLTHLMALLENELETDKEKQLFKSQVDQVIVPDM